MANPITSVNQLTDVKRTDWYFESLQSLVEKYGITVGYPDKTFRAEQALTRAEAVALLNQAMQQVEKMIQESKKA